MNNLSQLICQLSTRVTTRSHFKNGKPRKSGVPVYIDGEYKGTIGFDGKAYVSKTNDGTNCPVISQEEFLQLIRKELS